MSLVVLLTSTNSKIFIDMLENNPQNSLLRDDLFVNEFDKNNTNKKHTEYL